MRPDPDPPARLGAPPRGLTGAEARSRRARFGPNRLVPERKGRRLARLLRPLTDPMTLLLLVAGPTYLVIGDRTDAVVTLAAIAPIAAVGWVLETRAERAVDALARLTARAARVWRDGSLVALPAEELVPGDVVELREGDVVPADGVIEEATEVHVDESALTGESFPVAKGPGGDGSDVLAGTTVLSGRATVAVTATGPETRYGRIGALVAGIRPPRTPLQRLVSGLVVRLGAGAAVFVVAVGTVELARGEGWGAAVIAGVSLGIAAVPEEFPMVYTLYLALGAWRLARRQALVRGLPAVETLGSTTVICADKTGTLTEGHLEVAALRCVCGERLQGYPCGEPIGVLLEAAVLASEPQPFDPLDQAIVRCAAAHGVDIDALHAGTLVADHPFLPVEKYLTHVWRTRTGEHVVTAKGSIEGILDVVSAGADLRHETARTANGLAAHGMRVIAVAAGDLPGPESDRAEAEAHLALAGLVGFTDPLRDGVLEAVDECRGAGIRVVMITGDHPVTAHAVAEGLTLPHTDDAGEDRIATGSDLDAADDDALTKLAGEVNVFARVRPEQKHRLVEALRRRGDVVAMTGDGVNDAPALREADIGVAMGRRGSEVAREAAAMVLLDDNFATIVAAVRDGRRIFDALRRSFSYLVAFHPPLLLGALVVPLVGKPLLLLPSLLVLLELLLHPVVGVVFERDPAAPDLMRRPPRPPDKGLVGRDLLHPAVLGLTLSAGVLAVYFVGLAADVPVATARAAAFVTLVSGQLLLLLVERSPEEPVWRSSIAANRALPVVLGGSTAGLVALVTIPAVAKVFHLRALSPGAWAVAVGVAALSTLWWEPAKARHPRLGVEKRQ